MTSFIILEFRTFWYSWSDQRFEKWTFIYEKWKFHSWKRNDWNRVWKEISFVFSLFILKRSFLFTHKVLLIDFCCVWNLEIQQSSLNISNSLLSTQDPTWIVSSKCTEFLIFLFILICDILLLQNNSASELFCLEELMTRIFNDVINSFLDSVDWELDPFRKPCGNGNLLLMLMLLR